MISNIFTTSVFAASNSINANISILSEDTSEVDAYAIDTYQNLLNSHCYANGTNDNLNAILGSGFSVYDDSSVFYLYPVFVNNTVKYVYRVYKYGDSYSGVISEILAEELNNHFKTISGVVSFYMLDGDLVAYNGNSSIVVSSSPVPKKLDSEVNSHIFTFPKSSTQILVNPYTSLKKSSLFNLFNIQPRASISLPIDYLDRQGNQPWCAAFTSACILRYMTGNTNITGAYIAGHGHIFGDQEVPLSVIRSYANMHGVSVGNYINGTPAPSTVHNQMLLRCPIYLGMISERNSNNKHAVVLHGVDGNNFIIRNPWYGFSETFIYTGIYSPAHSTNDPQYTILSVVNYGTLRCFYSTYK